MRQIALDTETTGIEPKDGHRILEIGCVEIIGRSISGQTFYSKLNPEREVDEGARRVHGYNWEMLKGSPLFSGVCDEFLEFVRGSEVLIHNASFDLGFLNAELARLNRDTFLEETGCISVDTLELARKMHIGVSCSLNALSDYYQIDRSHRKLHGALIDADLLAQVYLAMTSGQTSISFAGEAKTDKHAVATVDEGETLSDEGMIVIEATKDELRRHTQFMTAQLEKN